MSTHPDTSVRLGNTESQIVPDARIADQLTAAARKRKVRRRFQHKLRQARATLLTDDRYKSGDYQICPDTGLIRLTNRLGQASSRQPRQLHARDYLTVIEAPLSTHSQRLICTHLHPHIPTPTVQDGDVCFLSADWHMGGHLHLIVATL